MNWNPKEKKCRSCKKLFLPAKPLQMVCSPQCGITYVKEQNRKKEQQQWRKEKKILKDQTMTLSQFEALARKVFQKWVRMRDQDLPCISCGRFSNRYDGGHYFDAGVYSGLIFNEDNVHKQCSMYCNNMMHGNKANYRIGLVKKIGPERVAWLEENKDRLRNHTYTKQELIEIALIYKQKIKKLIENGNAI